MITSCFVKILKRAVVTMLLIYIIFRTFRTNTSTTFHYQTVYMK